jgi:hypothetical protein
VSLLLSALLAVFVGVFITWILASLITPPSPGGDTDHSEAVAPGVHGAPSPGGAHAPAPQPAAVATGHTHHTTQSGESWWQRALVGLIVGATGGMLWLIGPSIIGSYSGWRENSAREKAEEARIAMNPDNHSWSYYLASAKGVWESHSRNDRVQRITNVHSGRITLRWRSNQLGDNTITASCIPGMDGSWSSIDTKGESINGRFWIHKEEEGKEANMDWEIHGVLEELCDDGKVHPLKFRFERKK